ncbi:DNA dC-_dU-editing enzyme APOBEC-3F-like isoform 5-T5 [Glossophaga mutica]
MRSRHSRKAEPVLGTSISREAAWPEDDTMEPWLSNPMEKLYADYFYFHFTNRLTPQGRNGCYICYEMEGIRSPTSVDRGVFENEFYPKPRVHTEVCFLNWFTKLPWAKTLDPGKKYTITWYMSWSPCVDCAEQVAEFLKKHNCVRLRIKFPRLYHGNKPKYQQGLRNLDAAGAELAVMCPEDFKYCWDNFVDNLGWSFWYWKGIRWNYHVLDEKLREILCNPMSSLSPRTYNFHFPNLPFASEWNNTYICFQVEERKNSSPKTYYKGVFRNQQGYPEEPLHAEQCFLSWFDDKCLSPPVDYNVTWYMSWSPCLECAEEVVSFLEEHENVSLTISISRLYNCDDEDEQHGLQLLHEAGAQVAMMSPEDFKYCWDTFVDNLGWSFWYWKGIRRNYYALDEKLREILCNPMSSLSPRTYNFHFPNLPFASGWNNTYICFQVEERKNNCLKSYYKGVFRNQPSHLQQGYPEEPLHAEQCFLSWFDDKCLSPRVDYNVTWYMSWSPCLECAEEVVSFLEEHENVSLTISFSRLYNCDDEDQQRGLQLLHEAGAQVAMMCPEDFEYCWDSFVDNRGRSFWYWHGICWNYHVLDEKLREILRFRLP